MENVILRKWELTDIDSVSKHANNEKIAANLRNGFPYPYTKKDAEEFIISCIAADEANSLFYAIDIDGEAVGSIGLFLKEDVYCKSAEVGYWLSEKYWGKGIMVDSIKQIVNIGFSKFDIVRIFAEPYSYNTGSRRVLEKAGFELEGVLRKSVYKNGKIFDSCIYAITK